MKESHTFFLVSIALFIAMPLYTSPQESNTSGFVIRHLEVEPGVSFDFFFPSRLDTTRSLTDNFCKVGADTLLRVRLPSDFPSGEPIACAGETVHVVPVKITWSEWMLMDGFLHRAPVDAPVVVSGVRIGAGYNAHLINSFMSWRLVPLKP